MKPNGILTGVIGSIAWRELKSKVMNCDVCRKGEMKTEIQQSYRYKECGLDNVYLLNMEVHVCDGCGIKVPG